jgi:hypothetical protein
VHRSALKFLASVFTSANVRTTESFGTMTVPHIAKSACIAEREVGLRGVCETVTIHRDDGSMKRIRRCD